MNARRRQPVRVALLPWMVAGVRTQYENLRLLGTPPEMHITTIPIVPYKTGGVIERLPLLRTTHKGTFRSALQALPLLAPGRFDVVWTQALLPLVPSLAAQGALRQRRPAIVYTIDTTPALMDNWTPIYYDRSGPSTLKRQLRDTLYRYALRRCALITPWSRWAARSFVDHYGVPEDRIRVLPPGVDLHSWAVPLRQAADDRLPRLLFVGADFARKGGPLLVDLYRQHLRGRCELHLVTKAPIPEHEGVRVHCGFGPNDAGLRALYARCDALVLPTRADCFSLATLEAMASGLPVITCPVGGIPEIVEEGKTGLLVPPDDGSALLTAIEALLCDPGRMLAMGAAGRAVVATRFDNAVQSRVLLDLLLDAGTALRQDNLRHRSKMDI